MAVDTSGQRTHCRPPGPSCHYNTIPRTINMPQSSASEKKTKGGRRRMEVNQPAELVKTTKEDVIKQKCLGTNAERWMLNRGGRALLR